MGVDILMQNNNNLHGIILTFANKLRVCTKSLLRANLKIFSHETSHLSSI